MKSAYERSLNLLSQRQMTEYTLRDRLASKGHPETDIKEAIVRLKELGYIDDSLYLDNFIVESLLKRRGRKRIMCDLEKVGFDRETIGEILEEQMPREVEFENAQREYEIIVSKLPEQLPDDKNERLGLKEKTYRKVTSKLNTLGYEGDIIYEVAGQVNEHFRE